MLRSEIGRSAARSCQLGGRLEMIPPTSGVWRLFARRPAALHQQHAGPGDAPCDKEHRAHRRVFQRLLDRGGRRRGLLTGQHR